MANNIAAGISEKWASALQTHLYESFVGSFISNTKFEGEFDGADTVHFPRLQKIVSNDLATSYTSVTVQDVIEADETFVLDTRKHFAVSISNEDYIEMKVNPNSQILKDGAEAFAKDYDTSIMSEYVSAGISIDDGDMETATNGGTGNSIVLSKTNVFDMITAISQKLDEANVADGDRFVVISPKVKRLIANSPEIVKDTSHGDSIIAGGFVGRLDNFKIYYSNNLQTATGTTHVLAGQGKPVCFAANIKPKVEITPSQYRDSFTNLVKAQTRFGVKTFAEGAEKLVDVQIVA